MMSEHQTEVQYDVGISVSVWSEGCLHSFHPILLLTVTLSQFRQKELFSQAYQTAKAQHMLEISQLYNKANTLSGRAFRRKLSKIDRKVIRWNEQSNRQDCYDLHGMSKLGAQRYVESIVAGKTGKFRFETGRGLHSTNNVAKIKNALLEEYQERPRFSILVDSSNYGVLVLDKW